MISIELPFTRYEDRFKFHALQLFANCAVRKIFDTADDYLEYRR